MFLDILKAFLVGGVHVLLDSFLLTIQSLHLQEF